MLLDSSYKRINDGLGTAHGAIHESSWLVKFPHHHGHFGRDGSRRRKARQAKAQQIQPITSKPILHTSVLNDITEGPGQLEIFQWIGGCKIGKKLSCSQDSSHVGSQGSCRHGSDGGFQGFHTLHQRRPFLNGPNT